MSRWTRNDTISASLQDPSLQNLTTVTSLSETMELLPCLVCDQPLPADPTARCITDCSHEFCLSCLCRHLAINKNRCPGCHVQVKRVTQLQDENAPKPAFVRFCNAVYTLNVSIWAVDDPAKVLASLFNLEHARLIRQGKLLKKGDVWPGSVVQLFGTQKGTLQTAATGNYLSWLSQEWLQRVKQIVCCPFSIFYDFFRSLFGNVEEQQQRGQRGYAPVPMSTPTASSFREPGRVPSPDHNALL